MHQHVQGYEQPAYRRRLLNAIITLLLLVGLAGSGYAVLHLGKSPLPMPSTSTTQPHQSTAQSPPGLPASEPTSISIPAINVRSQLAQVALNADGTPGIPRGADVDKAAWLTSSVTPGQTGTSVIIGHVDTVRSGPSVFYDLGKLSPGDKIYVGRQDTRTAVFAVDSVHMYDKTAFPSATVYGKADTPVLRLITCTGSWDANAHQYTQNLVVFASLSGTQ